MLLDDVEIVAKRIPVGDYISDFAERQTLLYELSAMLRQPPIPYTPTTIAVFMIAPLDILRQEMEKVKQCNRRHVFGLMEQLREATEAIRSCMLKPFSARLCIRTY